MTKSEATAMIKAGGGFDHVHALLFDNDYTVTFSCDDPMREDQLVTIEGVDYFVVSGPIRSKATKCFDHKIIRYHVLDCLQVICFAETAELVDDVDFTEKADLH